MPERMFVLSASFGKKAELYTQFELSPKVARKWLLLPTDFLKTRQDCRKCQKYSSADDNLSDC